MISDRLTLLILYHESVVFWTAVTKWQSSSSVGWSHIPELPFLSLQARLGSVGHLVSMIQAWESHDASG